jgi:hypothetical protein
VKPLVALVCAFLLAGCVPATRPREQVGEPIPPNYQMPESTLATLARSIHDGSLTNYSAAFADTILEGREFHATFDSADVAAWLTTHPSVPDDWNRAAEMTFFPEFVGHHFAPLDATFEVDEARGGIVDMGGPTYKQVWNVRYRVRAGTVAVVAGAAALTFERVGLMGESGDSKLTRWVDRRDIGTARTWGRARLEGGSDPGTFLRRAR